MIRVAPIALYLETPVSRERREYKRERSNALLADVEHEREEGSASEANVGIEGGNDRAKFHGIRAPRLSSSPN